MPRFGIAALNVKAVDGRHVDRIEVLIALRSRLERDKLNITAETGNRTDETRLASRPMIVGTVSAMVSWRSSLGPVIKKLEQLPTETYHYRPTLIVRK